MPALPQSIQVQAFKKLYCAQKKKQSASVGVKWGRGLQVRAPEMQPPL